MREPPCPPSLKASNAAVPELGAHRSALGTTIARLDPDGVEVIGVFTGAVAAWKAVDELDVAAIKTD